ncbi:PEP/pyruvate binding domain protein [Dissulfuribacter thermophilus]|uniref:Phosphoenolpyruvate synthase n=1 Tax=Dissulfuribacter thermophilus TaxID=1156395 RepID=A0A1B9F669_9BACT|nr:PEP/pyruvate-binding domain-containing protein [Dissulfuribacter thermophilus]OCC15416.1 PEP/pyruvate binding domain protein [Dissulfuribacter thermophilus]
MSLPEFLRGLGRDIFDSALRFKKKYQIFIDLLSKDRRCHDLMAELQQMQDLIPPPEFSRLLKTYQSFSLELFGLIEDFTELCPKESENIRFFFTKLDKYCRFIIEPNRPVFDPPFCLSNEEVDEDSIGLIGGKAKGIYDLGQKVGVTVPRCAFVTTSAFFYILDQNNLMEPINEVLSKIDSKDPHSIELSSKKILSLFHDLRVPQSIIDVIEEKLPGSNTGLYALRSSASFEDSYFSFAGQYRSILNCKPSKIISSYLKVIESKYSPNAIFYRVNAGLADTDTPMAVIIMEMINPIVSGVAYSIDPDRIDSSLVRISVVDGPGDDLVGGKKIPFTIYAERGRPIFKDGSYPVRIMSSFESIMDLPLLVEKIEGFFGVPLDIEWCVDEKGTLYFLQARPLRVDKKHNFTWEKQRYVSERVPILEGGEHIYPGCAVGRVFIASGTQDLHRVPYGAILVSANAFPEFSQIIGRIKGIITERGAITSHLATVAREFKVPAIFGISGATKVLKTGDLITLYVEENKVFKGTSSDICKEVERQAKQEGISPIVSRLRALLSLITPLTLTDPDDPNFRPEGCRSLHDILRYCHERAMQTMFGLTKDSPSQRYVVKIRLPIPLSIYCLDLEGSALKKGIHKERQISLDEVPYDPLKVLLRGLCHPKIEWTDRHHFDWSAFDEMVLSGAFPTKRDSILFASFAIISKDYLNLNLKFGYHFTVVDCFCSEHLQSNYLSIKFAGGGGTEVGRMLRLRFIKEILESWGFSTGFKLEELSGRITGVGKEDLMDLLEKLGQLLGYTKLLDLHLTDEIRLKEAFQKFEEAFG